ncbi:MAG: aminotransferase class V-fold PLP-dependent enzyme, partial [Anaerolineae bacterium]
REEEAQRIATEARRAVARLVNAPAPEGVIFTMNATQAINIGLKGILRPGDHVITSAIEHNAVWRPLKALERNGIISLTAVPCAPDGSLDPEDVRRAMREETRLLVMTHASNVLGGIVPIRELGAIAHEGGILFMVDAAQTAGAYPIDMQAMHIDLLAFAGHKGTYGPHGTGALVIRPDLVLETILEGGTGIHSAEEAMPAELPLRLEPGSQNAAGIAGLLAGVQFVLDTGVDRIREHEMRLASRLIERLKEIPGARILGPADRRERVAVVSLTVEGYFPEQLAAVLDKVFDVATRAGLHCAPQAHRTAGTFPDGALRFSPGFFNTEEDIDFAVQALHEAL